MANDPLSQFKTYQVFPAPAEGVAAPWYAITNVTVFTFVAVATVALFMALTTRRGALVPSRMQSVGELGYEFIAGMIRDVIGPEGMRFLPFVFALFSFILACNLLGMLPVFFTVTSQLSVTLFLGALTIGTVLVLGFAKHGLKFLQVFAPGGLPFYIYPLLVPIEIISFLSRPVTLGFRLFANMLAGHTLLKIIAGFVVSLSAFGGLGIVGAALPLFGVLAVTGLEFIVAFLQAYVFAMLTVIYLNDVVHLEH